MLFLLATYLSLYYSLFIYLSTQIKALSHPSFLRGIALSLFFVSSEFLRSTLFTGFPWGLLGYPLSNFLYLLQIADLLGIWGLSFIAIMINYFIYYTLKKTSQYEFFSKNFISNILCFLFFFLVVFFYGAYNKHKWENLLVNKVNKKSEIKISLLQGNIPQELKEAKEIEISLSTYITLTLKALTEMPHMIAYPETALPFYFPYAKEPTLKFLDFLNKLKSNSENMSIPQPSLIFGAFRVSFFSQEPKVHNTLFIWDGENISDFYDKEKLVPFGEYVPLAKYFPFLGKISVVSDIIKPGVSKNLKINSPPLTLELTPLICFESAFSTLSAGRVKRGGQVIFIATNDAWFGKTSAPYQHFQMAKVRAVEARRYVAQAANTGISGFIDPLGRVIKESSLEKEEIITSEIYPLNVQTFFVQYGYLFPYLTLIFSVGIVIYVLFLRSSHPTKYWAGASPGPTNLWKFVNRPSKGNIFGQGRALPLQS